MKYIYIICPIISLISCYLLKNIIEIIRTQEINIKRLMEGTGGMPSCHTAFASSLASLIGFKLGFDTPLFAISAIFTFIVSYDATTIRYQSGIHAEILNEMIENKKINHEKLREKLGHRKREVIGGYIIGILIGFLFSL